MRREENDPEEKQLGHSGVDGWRTCWAPLSPAPRAYTPFLQAMLAKYYR
jgi:hypothetical protein